MIESNELSERLMSCSEYARHRGVKPETVRYAIKVGKLARSLRFKKENGPPYIVPEIADGEWVLEVRANKTDSAIDWKSFRENADQLPTIADSRARREAADAELAELKLEKEKGKLVDAEEVRAAAFKAARTVRDSMMNIPDRLAGELAAETDHFRIHKKLTDEIRKALEGLQFEGD